jgi:hypothetical protein
MGASPATVAGVSDRNYVKQFVCIVTIYQLNHGLIYACVEGGKGNEMASS